MKPRILALLLALLLLCGCAAPQKAPAEQPAPEQPAVVLLTSEELSHQPALPGLERTLHHTPPARDARVCKAEVRSDCLAGTLVLPRQGKDGRPLACGYLVTGTRVVLVDDENALQGLLRRIAREKRWTDGSIGRFLYDFFEQLIARDLHQLEKIEDRIEALEDRVLAHELDDFSAPMTALRKETMAWFRYYSQLDDVACELHENENGFFTDSEQLLRRIIPAILRSVAENGLEDEAFNYIIDKSDTDLTVPDCLAWRNYISRLCENGRIIN